jgi:hypothetical protein
MIGEANLSKIMRAADRDDPDDVAIRKLIVSALRESRADFTELLHRSTSWIGTSPARGKLSPGRSGACLARAARTSGAHFTVGVRRAPQ